MLCPPYHHSHPLPGITCCLHTSQRQAASILLLLYLIYSFTAACFPPLLPHCLSSFHIPHHLPSPLLLCCVLLLPPLLIPYSSVSAVDSSLLSILYHHLSSSSASFPPVLLCRCLSSSFPTPPPTSLLICQFSAVFSAFSRNWYQCT